jgi:hypothetical protein
MATRPEMAKEKKESHFFLNDEILANLEPILN